MRPTPRCFPLRVGGTTEDRAPAASLGCPRPPSPPPLFPAALVFLPISVMRSRVVWAKSDTNWLEMRKIPTWEGGGGGGTGEGERKNRPSRERRECGGRWEALSLLSQFGASCVRIMGGVAPLWCPVALQSWSRSQQTLYSRLEGGRGARGGGVFAWGEHVQCRRKVSEQLVFSCTMVWYLVFSLVQSLVTATLQPRGDAIEGKRWGGGGAAKSQIEPGHRQVAPCL